MTDRDVVERVGAMLHRAVIPLPARKPHYKRQYATVIKGAPAVKLMNAVRPFLSGSRQSQIDRAIASWHGRRARWRRPADHCSVVGCPRRGSVRGLCRRHYDRWWKTNRKGLIPSIAPQDAPSQTFGTFSTVASEADGIVSWLAGLLEGEGTFGITGVSRLPYPVISLEMCDEGTVLRAARMLGATGAKRREPERVEWSPTYVAKIGGHRAAEWMRRLRLHMGRRRKAAIDAALAAYHPIRLTDVPTTCVVTGCNGPHRSRGLCNTHYMSWSRDREKGRTPRITSLR